MSLFPNVQEIEVQLRTLQHEASPQEARTSLFNLVIFLQNKDDKDLEEALNFLHGKRPARVIIVRRGCSGATSTSVTARCVEDFEHRGICIQEIVIFSGEDKSGEDPGAWGSLLIREIPTYLWWLDSLHSPQEVLAQAKDLVERVIIDSTMAEDPLKFFQQVLSIGLTSQIGLADLAWNRMSQIMKLTAQLFNPIDQRPRLHTLKSLVLTGGQGGEAFLYFSWIADKMGWEVLTRTPGEWELKSPYGSVQFIHKNPGPLKNGLLIEFLTQSKDRLTIENQNLGYATMTAPGSESYTAVFRIPSAGECLTKEVDRSTSDRLYLEAISKL